MLISLNWLQQYLPTIDQIDANEVAKKLSESIAEVESVTKTGEGVEKIVTGEIIEIKPHPKADKLQITQVKLTDGANHQIICGANNIKVGQKVPVCLPGGRVLDPSGRLGSQESYLIMEKELRGVKSQGMLCSAKELGLYDNHKGIMILNQNATVGEDLTKYIKDTILEIENKSLTHRSDTFSHLGIAREISAIYNLKLQDNKILQESLMKTADLPLNIELKTEKSNYKRFTAITIKDITIENSPFWMQAMLALTGMRPINNIVDISNYLMFDIGQPSHAFDYDKLANHTIILRQAKQNEKIETLDKNIYELDKNHIVFSDTEGPIGIPGIIGGSKAEISTETKNIALVVENWDMFLIRRISRDLGIRTEASTRFEKGLDPVNVDKSNKIITNTILELAGGEVANDLIDIYPVEEDEKNILEFDLNNVSRIIGIEISKEEIVNILERLQISVTGDEKIEKNTISPIDESNKIILEIPSFRRDLKIEEDIVEEIARIHGYSQIPSDLPIKNISPVGANAKLQLISRIKNSLSKNLDEVYTYSMVSKEYIESLNLESDQLLKIKNPLSPQLGLIRNSIIPSLLSKIEINVKNRFVEFGLFEISRVILKNEKIKQENIPAQPWHLAAVYYDKSVNNFYSLKGIVENLFSILHLDDIQFENTISSKMAIDHLKNIFHPAQTANIRYKDQNIGLIGTIHPLTQKTLNINGTISMFEIDIEKIEELMSKEKGENKLIPIPQFPGSYRDLSFWTSKDLEVIKILKEIELAKIQYLEDCQVVDIYDDPKKSDAKSITIQLSIRSTKRTLKEEEIEEVIEKITTLLDKKFKAKSRKND